MVINPNAQSAANATGLAGAAGSSNKSPARSDAGVLGEDSVDVAFTPRVETTDRASATEFSISDEAIAREAAEFARFHILANPSATMSVQANSSPEAVFELLQGVLAE